MKKILCFDLDNVVCKTNDNDYHSSIPNKIAIIKINSLYRKGFFIKIFTARYMGRNKENVKRAKSQGYKFTLGQLKIWGLKYNKLIFGKPTYDLFVDDKAIFFKNDWHKKIDKYLKK